MTTTKVPVELSSTPGIVDNSNATAITIDSSENVIVGSSTANDSSSVTLRADGTAHVNNAQFSNGNGSTGGTTPSIYSPASATLAISMNSAERLRVTSTGILQLAGGGNDSVGELNFGNTAQNANRLQIRHQSSTWIIKTVDSEPLLIGTANSEVARFETDGSFLVAKTSIGLSSVGFETSSGGRTRITRDNANVVEVNRKSSNGGLITFYKDATAVGSIGSQGGANIYISSGNRGVRLNDGDFSPITSANSYSDNTVDLGRSTARFKDLYLSGGAYLGGTTSANELSDYEEGTYTVTATGPNAGVSVKSNEYTKIGRLVSVDLRVAWTGTDNTDSLQFSLPFAARNPGNSTARTGIVFYQGTQVFSGAALSAHIPAGQNKVSFYRTDGGNFEAVHNNMVNGSYDWIVSFSFCTDA